MVNGKVYQFPNHAVLASDKRSILYIAIRPFDFKSYGAFVNGTWEQLSSEVKFANEEIADKVIALQNPMLLLQDGRSIPEAIKVLKDAHPAGMRYFVPIFSGSINPQEGMGVLEQYVREFDPQEIRVIGPSTLEDEMVQLSDWIVTYWRIVASLD